jgi:hypothetical protein
MSSAAGAVFFKDRPETELPDFPQMGPDMRSGGPRQFLQNNVPTNPPPLSIHTPLPITAGPSNRRFMYLLFIGAILLFFVYLNNH